eukprot:gnl/MRDRNA2_/MRDRNA2_83436_c0_seq3.p1 gnl/MRDRNA2_/MRDRNA2_83436_c0~~gnl/MRDRNA2_/MRDRNA2_83436_c0_seq3.p1  ORF type:complete len:400 (+),score=115.80 gnl/MRDRNA2_/MRDRNA2_83436_c0_seq3:137-1201(+)
MSEAQAISADRAALLQQQEVFEENFQCVQSTLTQKQDAFATDLGLLHAMQETEIGLMQAAMVSDRDEVRALEMKLGSSILELSDQAKVAKQEAAEAEALEAKTKALQETEVFKLQIEAEALQFQQANETEALQVQQAAALRRFEASMRPAELWGEVRVLQAEVGSTEQEVSLSRDVLAEFMEDHIAMRRQVLALVPAEVHNLYSANEHPENQAWNPGQEGSPEGVDFEKRLENLLPMWGNKFAPPSRNGLNEGGSSKVMRHLAPSAAEGVPANSFLREQPLSPSASARSAAANAIVMPGTGGTDGATLGVEETMGYRDALTRSAILAHHEALGREALERVLEGRRKLFGQTNRK